MNVNRYKVTDLAGEWVAGFRRPADGVMTLTAEQAEFEVRAGTLVLDETVKKKSSKDAE